MHYKASFLGYEASFILQMCTSFTYNHANIDVQNQIHVYAGSFHNFQFHTWKLQQRENINESAKW